MGRNNKQCGGRFVKSNQRLGPITIPFWAFRAKMMACSFGRPRQYLWWPIDDHHSHVVVVCVLAEGAKSRTLGGADIEGGACELCQPSVVPRGGGLIRCWTPCARVLESWGRLLSSDACLTESHPSCC